VTPTDYTHAVYSDFSGDDGFRFDRGSTACLTFAWVVTREDDLAYNEGIIYEIKRAVGCRTADELKYSSLRRRTNKDRALGILQNARVDVFALAVFKTELREAGHRDPETELREAGYRDPKTKRLVVITQSFPFALVLERLRERYGAVRPRIVADELHWAETQDSVISVATGMLPAVPRDAFQFRSSAATPMLQMADLVAGAVREFCEKIQETRQLPPCHVCRARHFKPRDCQWRRSNKGVDGFWLLKPIYPFLFKNATHGFRAVEGLYVQPEPARQRLEFVDCLLMART
jgi:hypothetical protein